MATVLLTWNPDTWSQELFDKNLSRYQKGERIRWSCGNTRHRIQPGDSVLLLKQGKKGRGLIGSGVITAAPYDGVHYDPERAKQGEQTLFVDVQFDYLSDRPQIQVEELETLGMDRSIYNTRRSGRTVPEEIAGTVMQAWQSRVGLVPFRAADELSETEVESCKEGARRTIKVNAYERDPEARRRCIEHWGCQCSVCDFHFEYSYGPIGKSYIHVHHLVPLSTIGEEYVVDPINDLRPVCPNCHAMLHRSSPPMTIKELQDERTPRGGKFSL